MTLPTLLVMTPTKWRRENCERLLKSFEEATDNANLCFITDADDQDTYADMDWGSALHAVMDPPGPTMAKVNHVATTMGEQYDALMYIGDDHLFSTPHWDTIMLTKLAELGGTGMLYGDDKRRQDIPESILISTDIVKALGYFMEPTMQHYYVDNVWADLGKRSGLLHFMKDVVFEHLHYQSKKDVVRDQTYSYAESMWGQVDAQAYQQWRVMRAAPTIAMLRRKFNPDVQWVLNKV